MTQDEPGALAEVGGQFHSDNTKALHGFPPGGTSFRNDPELDQGFRSCSKEYWKNRAKEF